MAYATVTKKKFFDEKIYEAINNQICYKKKSYNDYLIIHSRCICQYDFGGSLRERWKAI